MKINLNSLVIIFLLTGCSNQIQVRSDYDRSVNLYLYKTYGWLPNLEIESRNNPLVYNELTDKRIKKAVDAQFQIKGIINTDNNPELMIHYHIVIDDKSSVRPDFYGYHDSPYWMHNEMNYYQYQEGTLIIDLMDTKNNNLVWRGWAVSVSNTIDLDLTEEKINDSVNKILNEFAPEKK